MWDIVPTEAKVAGDEHKGAVCAWVTYVLHHPERAKTVLHGSARWMAPSSGRSLRARTLGPSGCQKPQDLMLEGFLYTATEHHVATLNRGEGKEGLRKVPIRKYIPERISLKGGGKEG